MWPVLIKVTSLSFKCIITSMLPFSPAGPRTSAPRGSSKSRESFEMNSVFDQIARPWLRWPYYHYGAHDEAQDGQNRDPSNQGTGFGPSDWSIKSRYQSVHVIKQTKWRSLTAAGISPSFWVQPWLNKRTLISGHYLKDILSNTVVKKSEKIFLLVGPDSTRLTLFYVRELHVFTSGTGCHISIARTMLQTKSTPFHLQLTHGSPHYPTR